jgi:hypothetical protein
LETSRTHITDPPCKTARLHDCMTDLTDVTFLVPLRIDSQERKENADALIKYTFGHFNTSFIVLEADSTRKFYPKHQPEGFQYVFMEDANEVFHRTKWINRLILMAKTPFAAVWDADAIAPPEQIVDAVKVLSEKAAVMSFPYDGRFYSCDKVSCDLFRRLLNIEILLKRVSVMKLMHGYHSVGGAFIVNKVKYLEVGGENENFYGWGPEDAERVKRLEILGLPIYYSAGVLFHLWHPIGKNSWFADAGTEKHNRRELQKTCKSSNYQALFKV